MRKIIFSVFIIIVAIILADKTSAYIGNIYSELFPKSVGSSWVGGRGAWDSLIGLPLTLIFFLTLLSYKLIFKSKQSVLWLLSPLLLFEVASDLIHIYIPIILIILAFALNNFVGFLIKKFKHSNPPMVIK